MAKKRKKPSKNVISPETIASLPKRGSKAYKEAKKRAREAKHLLDRGDNRQVILHIAYTRMNGTKAQVPTLLRHMGKDTVKIYRRLLKAVGDDFDWTSDKFRRLAIRIANETGVQLREVYTLILSP